MAELTLESLAERVAALEASLSQMRLPEPSEPRRKNWRRTLGMFAGDEVMKEIFQAGRDIREADRQDNPE